MEDWNIRAMLDSLEETGVYVIEQNTHRLLYFNRRIKDVTPDVQLGVKCHELWEGTCSDCPLLTIGDRETSHSIHYNDPFGKVVDIIANRMMWNGRIPAFVIIITPHKLNYEEEQGLRQIEKIYSKSLVTVFNECIIANLTKDFYVNCQKDVMWTDIPERGNFGAENREYSPRTIHPDDVDCFDAHFSRESMLRIFKSGKNQIAKRLRRKMGDGTYHMVEFTATRTLELGDEYWCVLVFRDVNEEYLLERKRDLDMSQLATAARVAYQMLIAVNLTQNTYQMLEYDRFPTKKAQESGCFDNLIEVGISTLDPDYRREFEEKFSRKALLEAFSRGEKKVTMEMRQMGDDGKYHWNSTQAVRVANPDSDDVLQITMSKDIDEERQQQEENLKKERMATVLLKDALEKAEAASRAKSDFLSRMSHDIRTPMNAIMGMTALAKLHIGEEGKLLDYLNKIEVSGAHLLGLINEVLDMNKIESGKVELSESETDLGELMQEVVLLVQPGVSEKRQELEVSLSEDMHRKVLTDKQRLSQVLVNILENASKYTQMKGTVRIFAEELGEEEDHIGIYRFVIEDTGMGMKKEFLEHIFEPFSRADDTRNRKIPGTGLGMTIVQNIVQMMGGDIKVESEYGKGSRFTLTFSMEKCMEPGKKYTSSAEDAYENFEGMRILLAEDNEMNQQIASEMLELLGVQVDIASDGQQAVDKVLGNPPFYYDLVFMDIQMPVMDGYEAARQIRSSGKEAIQELPIIALTADAFSEDVKKAKMAGMSDHLAKPISIDNLKSMLRYCRRWEEKNKRCF